jgi:hypothetical protein
MTKPSPVQTVQTALLCKLPCANCANCPIPPMKKFHDVIDNIENLMLYENSTPSQSTEKPEPSQKGPPKWLTKTLESVHPDEVGKI